jgi:predicted permease
MNDMTLAARVLRRDLAFTAVAVFTLAIAMAASTAMFSVYDQLVLNAVTLPDAASLVAVWFNNPKRNVQSPSISIPRYEELRDSAASFSGIGLSAFDSFTLSGDASATQLNTLRISASFFPTLQIQPALGRNFTPEEDVPNGPSVCIVSHELWQSQFGGRKTIVGETIQLNGAAWEVIGVTPPRLSAPFTQVQLFAPRVFEAGGLTPAQVSAGATFAQAIARLRAGVSLEQAAEELAAFSHGYKARHPGSIDANNVNEPRPFAASLVAGVSSAVYTLLGAVACVLVIACANVASLLLARILKRQKEVALRLSIGATRAMLVKQFLVETLVISGSACVLGIALAHAGLAALQPVIASQLPPNTTVSLSWLTLIVSGAVAFACTILTGLLPALQASRVDVAEQLKDAGRGSSAGRGSRARQMLIVAEVMLSVVLLAGAALLLVTFMRLQRTPAGFQSRGAAAAFVGLTGSRYAMPAQQIDFFDRVVAALRAQPGVNAAAVALGIPLSGGAARTSYGVAGRPLPPLGRRDLVTFNVVSDEFFDLLEIPLVEGRGFNADDRPTSPRVCVINQTLAKRLFAHRSALGESLSLGADGSTRVEIVGVIRDVKTLGLNVPTPDEMYLAARQRAQPGLAILGRTSGDPATLQASIHRAVADVDASQAISFFATLDTTVALSLGTQRLVATLSALFAAIAFGLALVGLYSVMAYFVSQRRGEIGIRMALGASRRQVVTLVMRNGLALVGLGLLLGTGAAALAGHAIRQLLFGIDPASPWIYAVVASAFALVAAAACLGPSLRASRIDPLIALRSD